MRLKVRINDSAVSIVNSDQVARVVKGHTGQVFFEFASDLEIGLDEKSGSLVWNFYQELQAWGDNDWFVDLTGDKPTEMHDPFN